MKQILRFLFVAGFVSQTHGQGLVTFANFSTTKVSTNNPFSGAGETSTTPNGYYYALLTAPSTVTSVDISLQQLLAPTWTFTGLYATNTGLAGRLAGGSGSGVPANGWVPGTTNSYIVVGWSASIGTTWSAAASALNGATTSGAFWAGGGIRPYIDWLGASQVAFGQAGGTDPRTGQTLPAWNMFGSLPTANGTPISSGFYLATAAPEPSPSALLGLALLLKFTLAKARG